MPTPIPGEWNDYTLEGEEGWLWWGGVFVPADFDRRSLAAAVFIAPAMGRASVPAAAQGDNGLSPDIDIIGHEVAAATALPTPNPAKTVIDPGGPGEAAHYQYDWYVHKGNDGSSGTFTLLSATDLIGTPGVDYYPAYTVDIDPGTGGNQPGATWKPQKVGNVYWPASTTAATSTAGPVTLAQTASIPSFPFDWRPEAYACATITGAAADVRVDLAARINNATTGEVCGNTFGIPGTGPAVSIMTPGPPAGSNPATYGRVAAGVSGTVVYLRAERVAGSAAFSIPADTIKFYVKVVPLP